MENNADSLTNSESKLPRTGVEKRRCYWDENRQTLLKLSLLLGDKVQDTIPIQICQIIKGPCVTTGSGGRGEEESPPPGIISTQRRPQP